MKDKVVVVTGAANGIGAAICGKFGEQGSKLALLDVDGSGLDHRVRELTARGFEVFGQVCDVTKEEECRSAIQAVKCRYGGIDVLVNNAGITQRCSFLEAKPAVYRRVMDINFFGAIHCTTSAIDSLIQRKGRIIVISSIAGLVPVLGRTGYCASKHALHGFFSALRAELRPHGVQVSIICPGFTRTNLQSSALDGDGSVTTHAQSTVGRQATPENVAEAVYRGAVKRKNLLVLTVVGKISHLCHKMNAPLYEYLMSRLLAAELRR